MRQVPTPHTVDRCPPTVDRCFSMGGDWGETIVSGKGGGGKIAAKMAAESDVTNRNGLDVKVAK